MVEVTGYVEHITFRNEENGYTVFSVAEGKKLHMCVGMIQTIEEGEYVTVSGEETVHNIYGKQIKVSHYEIKVPEDKESILRYLGSGAIKGLGMRTAERIVKLFGEDTLRIIDEEPERLEEVRGISLKKAMDISAQMEEKKELRESMLYLQKFQISNALAVKIYNEYGHKMYEILEKNPYRLAEDIDGVGFRIADDIAKQLGVGEDSEYRLRAGILYGLQCAGMNGHVYYPMEKLTKETLRLLRLPDRDLRECYQDLALEKKIVIKNWEGEDLVYLSNFYYAELDVANRLIQLNFKQDIDEQAVTRTVKDLEEENKIALDDLQRQAVFEAAKSGILVITGGPGTGKTTTIHTLLRFFEMQNMEILLAAPTGRAAKRMSEATGYEASTIHRLLEYSGGPEEDSDTTRDIGAFERNNENPLETDVVIIDEMSMVDIFLMRSLLHAITFGTRLILVGDVDQLPSVSPGNVLKDIIGSNQFSVVALNKIFRQAGESEIVTNAHLINKGEPVVITNKKDFLFVRRDDPVRVANVIALLVKDKLPDYVDADWREIQVLSVTKIGPLGTQNLNKTLQEELNPPEPGKNEKEHGDFVFREGDKVMQIKNNYQAVWEKKSRGRVYEEGLGVFNGDMGRITKINTLMEMLEVEFDDDRHVIYSFKDLDELELAYAVTVHKSQGSEYPAVVMPMLSGPPMLMNRNVLYTAVTRAKKCVVMVGHQETIQTMINNAGEHRRYSGLLRQIQGAAEVEE